MKNKIGNLYLSNRIIIVGALILLLFAGCRNITPEFWTSLKTFNEYLWRATGALFLICLFGSVFYSVLFDDKADSVLLTIGSPIIFLGLVILILLAALILLGLFSLITYVFTGEGLTFDFLFIVFALESLLVFIAFILSVKALMNKASAHKSDPARTKGDSKIKNSKGKLILAFIVSAGGVILNLKDIIELFQMAKTIIK